MFLLVFVCPREEGASWCPLDASPYGCPPPPQDALPNNGCTPTSGCPIPNTSGCTPYQWMHSSSGSGCYPTRQLMHSPLQKRDGQQAGCTHSTRTQSLCKLMKKPKNCHMLLCLLSLKRNLYYELRCGVMLVTLQALKIRP